MLYFVQSLAPRSNFAERANAKDPFRKQVQVQMRTIEKMQNGVEYLQPSRVHARRSPVLKDQGHRPKVPVFAAARRFALSFTRVVVEHPKILPSGSGKKERRISDRRSEDAEQPLDIRSHVVVGKRPRPLEVGTEI